MGNIYPRHHHHHHLRRCQTPSPTPCMRGDVEDANAKSAASLIGAGETHSCVRARACVIEFSSANCRRGPSQLECTQKGSLESQAPTAAPTTAIAAATTTTTIIGWHLPPSIGIRENVRTRVRLRSSGFVEIFELAYVQLHLRSFKLLLLSLVDITANSDIVFVVTIALSWAEILHIV